MSEYSSQNVVFGRAAADLLLATLGTRPAAALLAAGKLRLSKAPAFNPTPGMSLADLTADECDFTGYPAGGIAVALVTGLNVTPNVQGALTSGVFEWTGVLPGVMNNVTGYWIDDGTVPWVIEAFGGGQVFSLGSPGDFLVLNAFIPVDLGQTLVA